MDRRSFLAGTILTSFIIGRPVFAQSAEPIKVGVFPVGAALPYFVALERGYFADEGLAPETVLLNTPALIVQSLVSGEIDAAANLVSLEGANINARRPGTAHYISLVGQNSEHVFEQFVVRADHPAQSLADLKGARLFTSPGPANIATAKAILAEVGLADGADYQMQEQQLGVQIGALQSGNFDGGYTLEPVATAMIKAGIARRIEAGVISTYLLKKPEADTYAAGAVVSGPLLGENRDKAERFARAWFRGVADVQTDPMVRDYLVSDMNVPEAVKDDVPLAHFVAVRDLTEDQIADFQAFIDIGVSFGVVPSAVDVKTMVAAL